MRQEKYPLEALIVKTTFHSEKEAEEMARMLLDRNLIAAGQIATIQSFYWWEKKQHGKQEWELSCLTRASLYKEVEDFISKHHSFILPEIIGLPITAISTDYAAWIAEYTGGE